MGTRIRAPRTTCPKCLEEIFLDELVGGCCPLCGWVVEDEEDHEDVITRSDLIHLVFHYTLFTRMERMGINPIESLHAIEQMEGLTQGDGGPEEYAAIDLKVPMKFWERVRPKRCSLCRRLFVRSGLKLLKTDLRQRRFDLLCLCPLCIPTNRQNVRWEQEKKDQ